MSRIVCIIQARMGSTRLPGKVLMPIGKYPALYHTVKRTAATGYLVVLAIPWLDTPLVEFAAEYGIAYYRGAEHDVLYRYLCAAEAHDAEIIVRITGDCPLVDSRIVRSVVACMEENADYASNVCPHTYPQGLDVQAFTMDLLQRAQREAITPEDREHVCPWMERHTARLVNIVQSVDQSQHRWTLDTTADLAFFRALAGRLPFEPPHPTTEEVLTLMEQEPELMELNTA